MDFSISLGLAGWTLIVLAAIVVGVVVQLIGEAQFGYEWLITAAAAVIGAVVASEFVVGLRAFEPTYDGVALVPAFVAAVIAGVVVATGTRLVTGGSFTAPAAS
jgi:uncharacterized membrane protein YeaQ/YmgE (transglycosylase-associated protein family)